MAVPPTLCFGAVPRGVIGVVVVVPESTEEVSSEAWS